MLAACTGRDVPARASDGFVEGTFDSFAASFESKLAKLSYRAPALVAAMLEDAGLEPAKSLDVLDAGCGTGLCGPLVAPYARRLTGVDLSAGMLAQAREKNVYDELVKSELTAYLRDSPERSTSSSRPTRSCTSGRWTRSSLRRRRRCGPAACSSSRSRTRAPTRTSTTASSCTAATPLPGLRRAAARGAGLVPEIAQAELRMESGMPVAGLVVRATKRAGAGDDPCLRLHRAMEIATPLGDDVLLFHGMHAREELGRLGEFQLDLLSPKNDINLDDILGKNVTVKLALPDDSHALLQRLRDPLRAGRHPTAATSATPPSSTRGSGS